jgi:hypothetical protein
MSFSEFSIPLVHSVDNDNDNDNDPGSQQRLSLLERIQAQRNRELSHTAPDHISVSQYNLVQQPDSADHATTAAAVGSHLFSNAWNAMSASVEQGRTQSDMGAQQDALLLPPSAHQRDLSTTGEYSMNEYFMTFVRDMYGVFQSLPVWARWVVCAVLLYIAIQLL